MYRLTSHFSASIVSGNIATLMRATSERRRLIWIALALVLLTLVAYWPVFFCEFVNYDDPDYVTQNRLVKAGLTWEGLRWAFTTNHLSNWHPLTWLSHMLDCQFYGVDPLGHHITNLLIHLLNSLLLFALLHRLTAATWRSAFVAAMFALHPTHVESVAWVSERKDVLSTFFGLISTWFYVGFVSGKSNSAPGRTGSFIRDYSFALFFFACSLLSKGMLVTLPFVWLLLDWWPMQRFGSVLDLGARSRALKLRVLASNFWPLFREKFPFIGLSILFSIITYMVQTKMTAAPGLVPRLYTLSIPITGYLRYVGKLLYPTNLSAFYPVPSSYNLALVSVIALLLIAVSVLAFWRARKYPWLMVGWFWFVGTLLPVIGFVKVGYHSIADRYTYVPSIGFFILVAWGAYALVQRYSRATLMLGLGAAAAVVGTVVVTHRQVSYWQNSETLFQHALSVTKDNFIAHFCLGYVYQMRGDIPAAEQQYNLALAIKPTDAEVLCNLGNLLADQGKLNEAIEHYNAALRTKPRYAQVYNNLGQVLAMQGLPEQAAEKFREAIRLKPDFGDAHSNLGGIFLLLGKQQDAVDHCLEAVRLIPEDHRAHFNLGCALVAVGREEEAIPAFRQTLRLAPDFSKAMNELAWILATHPDSRLRNGAEAVQLAERACALTDYKVLSFVGTLDAAYAERGQFEKAIATAEKVRDSALAREEPDLFVHANQRLALYQSRKPFRSEPVKP